MYDEDYRLIEAVNATVLPKGFVRTSNLNIVLVMKRKKTLESDAMNHSNNFCHPAHDDEQQQHATADAATVAVQQHTEQQQQQKYMVGTYN